MCLYILQLWEKVCLLTFLTHHSCTPLFLLFLKNIKIYQIKDWKPEVFFYTTLTGPAAMFHFLDSTYYFIFFCLELFPFPYGFSFMFVLRFNCALGSTLEWVCLCKMIGGWVAARDSWSLRNCLGAWNTLTATALKVPWCSWSHAAFDTPSSFNILFDILDVDLFLSAFPEMNLFHLVIFSMLLWCIRIILTHGSVTHRQWYFSCWNCLLTLSLKAQLLSIPHSQSKYFIYQGLTEYAPEF